MYFHEQKKLVVCVCSGCQRISYVPVYAVCVIRLVEIESQLKTDPVCVQSDRDLGHQTHSLSKQHGGAQISHFYQFYPIYNYSDNRAWTFIGACFEEGRGVH